jgi:thiol-disulfide isomerase/thioredoxin
VLRTMKIVSQYNVNVNLCRVLFCVVLLFSACDYVPQQSPSLAVNSASPLVSVDRGGFDQVIARKAGKVVLVDFWASWCPPCQHAFPHTVQLYQQLQDKGLTVVSVSLDSAADQEKAQYFLDSVGATFENLICTQDNAIEIFEIPDAIPYYTLYDRQGRLRYRFSPLFTDGSQGETPASIDQRVQELLAE